MFLPEFSLDTKVAPLVHAKHERARGLHQHFGFQPSPPAIFSGFLKTAGVWLEIKPCTAVEMIANIETTPFT
jgi:hypothetical protein